MSDPIDQEAIKQMYQRLISERDQSIDATESIIQDIAASRKFQDTYCCSDPFYKEQIQIIKGTLPENVINGTVGSYLYGCLQPELAVEIGCTPSCSSGLRNPDVPLCDISSYEKKNGTLSNLNTINTEDANIFITGNEQLTNQDIQQLRQNGVKIITIFTQDGNTINYILGESINLDEPYNPSPPPPPQENPTYYGWGWIWLILVIIVIIILVVAFFR